MTLPADGCGESCKFRLRVDATNEVIIVRLAWLRSVDFQIGHFTSYSRAFGRAY